MMSCEMMRYIVHGVELDGVEYSRRDIEDIVARASSFLVFGKSCLG